VTKITSSSHSEKEGAARVDFYGNWDIVFIVFY